MEYRIVMDYSASGLERKVNAYMKDGWRPIGGLAINPEGQSTSSGSSRDHYFQAMFRG